MGLVADIVKANEKEISESARRRRVQQALIDNPNLTITPGGQLVDSETGEVANVSADTAQGLVETGNIPVEQIATDPTTPGTAGPQVPAASIGAVLAGAGSSLNTIEEINALEGAITAQAALNVQTAFAQPFMQFDKSAVAALTDTQLEAQGLTRAAAEKIAELGGQGQQALGQLFAGTDAGRLAEQTFANLSSGDQLKGMIDGLQSQVGNLGPGVAGALESLRTLQQGGQLDQAGSAALALLGQQVPGVGQSLNTLNAQSQGGVPGLNDIVNQLSGTPGALPGTQALQAGLTPVQARAQEAAGQVLGQQGLSAEQQQAAGLLGGLATQEAAGVGQAQQALTGLLGAPTGVNEAALAAAAPILRELRQTTLPGIQAAAIQQGAFGGSRQQLLQQQAALDASQRAAEVAAGVGLQAQIQGGQLSAQAAQSLGQLGLDQQTIQQVSAAALAGVGAEGIQAILQAGGLSGQQAIAAQGLVQEAAGTLQAGGIAQQQSLQQGLQAAGQLGISQAEIQQRAASLAGQLGISAQEAELQVIQQLTGIEVSQAGIQQQAAGVAGQLGQTQQDLDRQALVAAGGLTAEQAAIQQAGGAGLLDVQRGEQAGLAAGISGLPTVSGVLQQPGQLLQGVGLQEQAQEQAVLSEEERRFRQEQDFQRQSAIQAAAAASSLTGGSGFIQANVQPGGVQQPSGPSTLERGLGLLSTGVGIAGATGLLGPAAPAVAPLIPGFL